MDRRTYSTHLLTVSSIHPKCKGLPGVEQGLSRFHSRIRQGKRELTFISTSLRHLKQLLIHLVHPQLKPTMILSQTNTNKHPSGGPQSYVQYVRHLENVKVSAPKTPNGGTTSASSSMATGFPSANGVKPTAVPQEMQGYSDWLQAPLQPLMDDLGSATYEVFERDPVKYRLYEEVGVWMR